MHCLSSLTACKSARSLQVVQSSSHTAELLSIIMPEMYDDQHLTTSESLCHPRQLQLEEPVRVFLFLLFNNFTLGSGRHEGHELIMGILRNSGLNSLQAIRELFSIAGATAEAIAERLFESALWCCDMEVIQLMLKVGVNPNTIVRDYENFVTNGRAQVESKVDADGDRTGCTCECTARYTFRQSNL